MGSNMFDWSGLKNLLSIRRDDEVLLRAQLTALDRQVPLLYIMVWVGAVGLAMDYYGTASNEAVLIFPGIITLIFGARVFAWYKNQGQVDDLPINVVVRKLKVVFWAVGFLSVSITAWGWMLASMGSSAQQAHASFFIAFTLVGTVFALVHFAPAPTLAILVSGSCLVTSAFVSGDTSQMIIAVNLAVILVMVLALVHAFQKGFVKQVRAHEALEHANHEMKKLNAELTYHRDNLKKEVAHQTAALRSQTEKLEKALEAERELTDMQNHFVAMVSHEFRTPLTVIDASAHRVERRIDAMSHDDVRERMNQIRKSVGRLSSMVERTLDASRIASGQLAFVPEDVSLANLLRDVVGRHREIATDHDIQLHIEDVPEHMLGDPRLLDQIMSNLLSNAIKYSKGNPVIRVSLIGADDKVTLKIRDHGVGIPKSELHHVADRFFRASTSKGFSGTGIGLNLVSSLVKLHNGCFHIDSEEGQWTEVTIALPVGKDMVCCCGEEAGVQVEERPLRSASA